MIWWRCESIAGWRPHTVTMATAALFAGTRIREMTARHYVCVLGDSADDEPVSDRLGRLADSVASAVPG
jgi:hypothetical protein